MCYDRDGGYMVKTDIMETLNKLELDKDKYIVISDASLVVQDIIEEALDIHLSCSKEYYDSLNWNKKIGFFGIEIKYKDNIEISYNLYDPMDITIIDDFQFMNLEKCLDIKKLGNQKKDKKLIQKLDLYLCKKDNKRYEKELYQNGITMIGGVDEVGRGPLIGPVVAACCVLNKDFELKGLTDSKQLSEKKREVFYEYIKEHAIAYGIGVIEPKIIDDINIYEATKLAMKKAILEVQKQVPLEHVLIDAMPLDLDIQTTSIIKGDIKSISIAAASVLAKVTRDHMMYELHEKYPMYGFDSHKGYPTKKHIEAIKQYGLIEGYRKTYGPVTEVLHNR